MLLAAATAHAQSPAAPGVHATADDAPAPPVPPVPIDELTLADDLIGVTGMRPIAKRRVEVLLSTGTEASHQAALRGTDRLGSLGFELDAYLSASDTTNARSAATARVEHDTERTRARAYAGYEALRGDVDIQLFDSDIRTTTYGGAWSRGSRAGRIAVEAFGGVQQLRDERPHTGSLELDSSEVGARAELARAGHIVGFDHDLRLGAGLVLASGTARQELVPDMPGHMMSVPRTRRGEHRFLSAYIKDTIRVIESLDMSGGFVFETWRWLSSHPPLSDEGDDHMDLDGPDLVEGLLAGPHVGAMYRIGPRLALHANGYRKLRMPSWHERMRPVQTGAGLTLTNDALRPETITGVELGPALALRSLEARAVAYVNDITDPIASVAIGDGLRQRANFGRARETGIETAASWRIAKPWLARVTYRIAHAVVTDDADPRLAGKQLPQRPRQHATALVAFDDPELVTLTGAVHYVGTRYEDELETRAARAFAVIDAMAARTLTGGIAGFVAVENLLDRRYVAHDAGVDTVGAPRVFRVGLRVDSARW